MNLIQMQDTTEDKMKNVLDNLGTALCEFDHLYQEGVVLTEDEIKKFDLYTEKLAAIRSELSHIKGLGYLPDIFNLLK